MLLCATFASCAGSGGGAVSYGSTPVAGAVLNSSDNVAVAVTPAAGMADFETSRLTSRVKAALDKKRAGNSGPARKVAVHVQMSRYDKGNAFARAMLAGLGQIHIDANVTATAGGNPLMSFPVKKTFAWGGMMGGMTDISQVEVGFAEKVAGGLTGKK